MALIQDAKQIVPHFTHDPEYNIERQKWRNLMRSLKTAKDNMERGGKPKPRKRKNDPGPGETTG